MKEIKAIFQPFMLDSVLEKLEMVDHLPAATVSEVGGYSVLHPEYAPKPKLKLEIMVADEQVDLVIDAIQQGAHTGKSGDGRIVVINVEKTVKIRTGAQDMVE